MITCKSLHLFELDNPEEALNQLNAQLSQIELKSNTTAIIMCHSEFVDSGVLLHVTKNLPFDVVGITSLAQAVNEVINELVLTVFVMTSDEIKFRTGISKISHDADKNLKNAVKEAAIPGEAPGLILCFPSTSLHYAGDYCSETWEDIFPGTAVAGCMSCTDMPGLAGSAVVCGEEICENSIVFLMLYGAFKPRFVLAALSDSSRYPYTGVITKMEGNKVYELNGKDTWTYLEKIGIVDEHGEITIAQAPFLIETSLKDDDGIPVLRLINEITKEHISVYARGIGNGSKLTMLSMTPEDTLLTTGSQLEQILNMPDVNGVLIFSCISRYSILLSGDSTAELQIIKNKLGDIPFMAGYAGGEFCPTSEKGGIHTNRFHNYSLVAVVL